MGVFVVVLGLVVFASVRPQTAHATTDSTLSFQARLQTAAGAIVPDGYYNIEFKLYAASSGGTALWTEDQTYQGVGSDYRVRVTNGYVSVYLGSVTAFSSTINWDQPLWLTMNIGGTTTTPSYDGEMNPRLQLSAVPYAFRAGQLATSNAAGTLTSTLSILAPTGGNQTFQIQDQGATGTFSILTAPSGSDGYVKLQGGTPGTAQSGNLNINGTAIAGTLQAGTLDTPSGTTTLNVGNTTGTTNATTVNVGSATGTAVNIGGGILNVDITNGKVSVGSAIATTRFSISATNNFTALGVNQTGSGKLLDIQSNSVSVITADNYGDVAIKPATNALSNTSAFNVQQSISWFNVDTTNGFVINNGTTSPDNILQNPGFESNASFESSGWSLSSNGTIQTDATNAHSGTKVLELAATGAGYTVPTAKYYAVTPGDTYYVEGWTKAASGTNGSANLNITFYDANKATPTSNSVSANSSTTYTLVSGTATVPAGKYFMRIAPVINASSTTGTWYFDDLYAARANQQQAMVIHPAADNTNLFQVQNAATTSIFNVDTTGSGAVTVGNTLSVGASVNAVTGYKFNGTAGSTTTCTGGNVLQNAVIQGGIVTGGTCVAGGGGGGSSILNQTAQQTSANFNIDGSGTIGTSLTVPTIQSSGSLSIQASGTNSLSLDTAGLGTVNVGNSNAGTVNIANNALAHTVAIATSSSAAQAVTVGSTNASSTTTLQGGSNITLLTNSSSASIIAKTGVNSTTGFQIQNSSSVPLFNLDTTTGNIILGSTASGNYITFSASTGFTATGNAQHSKTILLTPEYAGAVLDSAGDSSCNTVGTSNGTMTSGYDNSSGRTNYYNWMSTQTTNQCYDVVIQVPIPVDFNGWNAAPNIQLKASATSNTAYGIAIVDSSNTFDANYTSSYAAPGTLGTSWANMSTSSLSGTYTAGDYMTIKIRLTAKNSASIQLGNIKLTYNSKF